MDPPETPESALRIWYTHLWAPKVDLIGDIAGKEPFLIHGESLIRHCLEESPANFQGEYGDRRSLQKSFKRLTNGPNRWIPAVTCRIFG